MNRLPAHLANFLLVAKDHFLTRRFVFEMFSVVFNRAALDVANDQSKSFASNRALLTALQQKHRLKLTDPTLTAPIGTAQLNAGKDSEVVFYVRGETDGVVELFDAGPAHVKPLDFIDEFVLPKGGIANYPNDRGDSFVTTVGIFFVNQLILAQPFGDAIPYTETMKDVKKREGVVAEGLLAKKFTVNQYAQYINNLFILQSYAELAVPTASWKSLTTHPGVPALKKQLLKEYRGRLNDPLVAKVVEDQLKALDSEHIKGDNATRFIDALGSKGRDIHRKKLFLMVGGIEDFSDVSGQYIFMPNSLNEGWDPHDFPAIVNEIRKGAYNRGKETELGGMQTKYIMRIFSDVTINGDDCGTTDGVEILLTEEWANRLLNRYIIVRGKPVELTKEVAKTYLNTVVKLRTAMMCKHPDGFCYTCIGRTFKDISTSGVAMLLVDITSTFTNNSMKNMHGTSISVYDLAPEFANFFF